VVAASGRGVGGTEEADLNLPGIRLTLVLLENAMPAVATVTMSTKGQVVIPRALREHLGWGEGTRLEIVRQAGGVVIRPLRSIPETKVDDLLGLLKYAGPPKTIEEMNDAIAKGAMMSAGKER
jgi:AbrB family looped-hinge helix DNA binding protein